MADVHVPLLGDVPKGGVFAGMLAVVGVGGYLIYKKLKKPATPPVAATGYGYGYGTHAYGYGYAYGGYSPYGYGGFGGGIPFPYGYQPSPFGYGGGPPTTNAQWGQDAEAAMGSNGHDAIAAALGKYLTGSQITQAQYGTVQEAIAVEGYPPQEGTIVPGYPPKAHVVQGNGNGGGKATNPVTGLHVSRPGYTGIDVRWNAAKNATSYEVTTTHGNVTMIGTTSARIHDIGRNKTATVSVLAEPASSNAKPATITVKTK